MPINYSAIAQKIEEGQIDKALQLADEALVSSPADAQVLYLKGQAYMKRSEWGQAMLQLKPKKCSMALWISTTKICTINNDKKKPEAGRADSIPSSFLIHNNYG